MTWQQPGGEQGDQRPPENPDPNAAPPPPPGYGEPPAAPSPYGQPPATPPTYSQPEQPQYGQPTPPPPSYGQPQYGQPQYGQPQYGQPQYGQPQYGQPTPPPPFGQAYGFGAVGGLPAGAEYASWGARVGASLLDGLVGIAIIIPFGIVVAILAAATSTTNADGTSSLPGPALAVLVLGYVAVFAFQVWNIWRSGTQGQSLGKQWVGIHLVGETTLRPPGGGTAIGKTLLRALLGAVTCNIYTLVTLLWPLWDVRKQTLDDKIVHTLVVRFPGNRLP